MNPHVPLCLTLLLTTIGPVRAQFSVEPAFPGLSFDRPVDLQNAGDGSGRLFVVEQHTGAIRVIVDPASATEAPVFLDIDGINTGNEEGLLGLAFHPAYESNGYFFVYYSAPNPRRSVVSRFSVDTADPNRADPASELVILEVNQPFGNHNGGQLAFGPADGHLYIGLGDGGSGGDPLDHGENPATLLGSILRIDVDNSTASEPYTIPPDNPFVGNGSGWREEIYAYGLRNPWRFSFDPETGRLWAGDVGQGRVEEIDVIEKGGNYGWDVMEGSFCFEPSRGCDTAGLEPPVWEYGRSLGQSVTGGYVYRGDRVPDLAGRYIYADFVSGRIWALAYDGAGPTENEELLDAPFNIAAFGVGEDRTLYICAFDGSIYRFVAQEGVANETPEAAAPVAALGFSYPNPFRHTGTIPFALNRPAYTELAVFDLLGRRVATLVRGTLPAGNHTTSWHGVADDGHPLPGGVYFYRLLVDSYPVDIRIMTMVR